MRILVITLSGIGDALMFTPALKRLKEIYPKSEIDALTMFKGVEDLCLRLPEISRTHYFNFIGEGYFRSLRFVFSLRRNKYDLSICAYPSNRLEYNIISLISGARLRAQVKYLRKDFANFGFLNNVRILENDRLHNVSENMALIEKFAGSSPAVRGNLALNFPLRKEDCAEALEFLKLSGTSGDECIIGFHAGCNSLKNQAMRRWGKEKFAELGRLLVKNRNAKIFIFGGEDEADLKGYLRDEIGFKNSVLVRVSSIATSAALMKYCRLFVSNDSGLMHIASAMNCPVLALIGPTNLNYIHPWMTRYRVARTDLECMPCFYYSPKPLSCSRSDQKFKCMKDLSVESVYSIASEMLVELTQG